MLCKYSCTSHISFFFFLFFWLCDIKHIINLMYYFKMILILYNKNTISKYILDVFAWFVELGVSFCCLWGLCYKQTGLWKWFLQYVMMTFQSSNNYKKSLFYKHRLIFLNIWTKMRWNILLCSANFHLLCLHVHGYSFRGHPSYKKKKMLIETFDLWDVIIIYYYWLDWMLCFLVCLFIFIIIL